MQLKWFFFIGFILNVFGLSTPGGKYLIPKNDPIEKVLLSLHKDKSLLASLQPSFAQLFDNAGPEVIYQITGFLEDLSTEASTVLGLLESEVVAAYANFDDAQAQHHVAQSDFDEQSPPLYDALAVLQSAITDAEHNLWAATEQKEVADTNLDEQSPVLNEELNALQQTITDLHSVLDLSYTLVFRQTFPKFFVQGETRVNADDSGNANYAILDELESYRNDEDGLFYFRLMWPQDTAETPVVYDWSQSSNPVNESIAGYKAIKIPFTGQYWGGLEPSTAALMDGSVSHGHWFYAVGSYGQWSTGIPAYAKSDQDYLYAQQEVELYVWKKV